MKTQNPISAIGGKNVAGYIGEITWFADNILRQNHVWADGTPIDAEQWQELAEYAATAGWTQNEDGQYLTPDLSGRVLISASENHAVGTSGGEEEVALTADNNGPHAHKSYNIAYARTENGANYVVGTNVYGGGGFYSSSTSSSGTGAPHQNMQPYFTAKAQIRARVDKIIASVVCPYEIGDILTTGNPTHPSNRWPGTEWTAIETFVLGASKKYEAGTKGGEEEHTLTINEMPSHNHTINYSISASAGTAQPHILSAGNALVATNNAGGNQPHNIMPIFTAKYIWERTA